MSTKKTNNEPIALDEALGKSEAFILKYKTYILAAIAAIVVVVAGSILYSTYVAEPREKEASEAMFKAEGLFAAKQFEQALDGDGINLGFVQIIEEYSGTNTANLANAYAGISLAQLGRYDEAIEYLKDFDGDDQMVAPSVLGTLGNCYAQKGDNDAAVKNFIKAAETAENNTVSPHYLLQAGIICEQQGDNDKALDLYTQIKEEYPASIQAMDIEKYISRVK